MSEHGVSDDNWLHVAVFPCPGCREPLFRVDHSPFADDYHFYCDQCANSVEISFYDAVTRAIDRGIASRGDTDPSWERERVKRHIIEARLRPCVCGGQYESDAPRRCPLCQAVTIADWPEDVDLWPGYMWWEEDRDPTPEESERAEAYITQTVRQRDIWRDGVSDGAGEHSDGG